MKQDRPRGNALSLLLSRTRFITGLGRRGWVPDIMIHQHGARIASTASNLLAGMNTEIDILMATQRVTLLQAGPPLVRPDATKAIISGVLTVRVDTRTDGCSRRRKRLYFDGPDGTAIVLVRRRPMPAHLKGRPCLIQKARMISGRRVMVSCLDLETNTLHVLVDLAGALPVTSEPTRDARLIIDTIYGTAIRELLSRKQPVHIGGELAETTLHLLGRLRRSRNQTLEKELKMLRTLVKSGHMPRSLQVRADRIQEWLAENPEEPQMKLPVPPATDGEGSRLTHLVESRACGYIHISPGEIRGLANPRIVDGYGLHPRLFRLRLPGQGESMTLDFWNPLLTKPTREPACLGAAASVFLRFQKMQDIYGTVDFILGFLETNEIGVFPLNDKPVSPLRPYWAPEFICQGVR